MVSDELPIESKWGSSELKHNRETEASMALVCIYQEVRTRGSCSIRATEYKVECLQQNGKTTTQCRKNHVRKLW